MRRGEGEGEPLARDVVAGTWSREELLFFGRLFGLLAAVWLVGFEISALLFTLSYLRFKARESWLLSIVITAVLAALMFGLLDKVFHVGWPQAALEVWLDL